MTVRNEQLKGVAPQRPRRTTDSAMPQSSFSTQATRNFYNRNRWRIKSNSLFATDRRSFISDKPIDFQFAVSFPNFYKYNFSRRTRKSPRPCQTPCSLFHPTAPNTTANKILIKKLHTVLLNTANVAASAAHSLLVVCSHHGSVQALACGYQDAV